MPLWEQRGMAKELPLPDSAQPGTLCYTATSSTLGWCQPSPAAAQPPAVPVCTSCCQTGWKRLWSDSREAKGCSGLQQAHPQPGHQFHPKPHLQVRTKRYKNTKVATAASNPQIPARFPSRASSGATLPTGPHVQD